MSADFDNDDWSATFGDFSLVHPLSTRATVIITARTAKPNLRLNKM
jgi:hypothetical protein